MSKPYCIAVIGKNFGDEGKGLATDYFSDTDGKVLVVRHNGGAQSGHTVEIKESEKRFVFHELSSGSFRHGDTFWASTYFPDLYKLREEIEDFKAVSGFVPNIFASEKAKITTIDDILLNVAAETIRDSERHGSCGMGIWEATLRSESGFGISLGEMSKMNTVDLFEKLLKIRNSYTFNRMAELEIVKEKVPQYWDLLTDESVLRNYAEEVINELTFVKIIKDEDLREFAEGYCRIVFEGGQGLLLDAENEKYSPHVTASRTGLFNPTVFLTELGWNLDEAVYVTRSYLTRHGAGPFETECDKSELGSIGTDETNITNEFQGSIRYGRQFDTEEFWKPVEEDLKSVENKPQILSLFETHLNESPFGEEYEIGFDRIYCSYEKYSDSTIVKTKKSER